MSNSRLSGVAALLGLAGYVAIGVTLLLGWILNIVKLIQADTISGMEIARVAGIFVAPLGGLLGYF
jgi:pheromone shutdown protein TraB